LLHMYYYYIYQGGYLFSPAGRFVNHQDCLDSCG